MSAIEKPALLWVGRLRALNLDAFTHLRNKGVLVDRRCTVVTSHEHERERFADAGGRSADRRLAIGAYFKRVVDVEWEAGIDPPDVPQHAASIAVALERVDGPTQTIHPADARVI